MLGELMGDLLVNWPPLPPILLIYHSNRAPTSGASIEPARIAANARWLSTKMHHAGEGMVGERALAQHLAARGRNLVVVLHRAAADADCSEQYAVLDDRQNSRMPCYQRLFGWFLSFFADMLSMFVS